MEIIFYLRVAAGFYINLKQSRRIQDCNHELMDAMEKAYLLDAEGGSINEEDIEKHERRMAERKMKFY